MFLLWFFAAWVWNIKHIFSSRETSTTSSELVITGWLTYFGLNRLNIQSTELTRHIFVGYFVLNPRVYLMPITLFFFFRKKMEKRTSILTIYCKRMGFSFNKGLLFRRRKFSEMADWIFLKFLGVIKNDIISRFFFSIF